MCQEEGTDCHRIAPLSVLTLSGLGCEISYTILPGCAIEYREIRTRTNESPPHARQVEGRVWSVDHIHREVEQHKRPSTVDIEADTRY